MQCIDLQHKPYMQLDGGAIVSMLVRQAAGQAVSLELIQISKLQSSNLTPKFDFEFQIIKTHLDCLHWERSCCCLSTEHDAICSVQHCVGNVCGLSTSGAGVLDHTLKHLCGCDNWLACMCRKQGRLAAKIG